MSPIVPYRPDLRVESLRRHLAPQASDEELLFFSMVCTHLDLDPFAGEIWLVPRRGKVLDANGNERWARVHKPQISVDGRRVIAQRTGRMGGTEGPLYCGPRRLDEKGHKLPLEWEPLWTDDDDHPYAARYLVYPKDWDPARPANGTAKWSEFAVYDDKDRTQLGLFWEKMPSHMLGKVAEALALRRGFAEVQAAVAYAEGPGESFGRVEPDDAAALAEVEASAMGRPADQDHHTEAAVSSAGAGRSLSGGPPRRGRDEGPPPEYYDNLPEARGYR